MPASSSVARDRQAATGNYGDIDAQQDADRIGAGDGWIETGLVFTTQHGTPIEPRNFNRSFDTRCAKADVPRIRVRDTRRACAPILTELGVHPAVVLRILQHAKLATRAAVKELSGVTPDDPEQLEAEA